MFIPRRLPLLRHAYFYALPLACAFTIAAAQPVLAQTQTDNDFASSTQALVADSDGVASPAAPSPAAGVGAQDSSYGYHDKSITSHLTFEGGGGANAPIGNDLQFITWGGNFTVGGGYRFSKRLSALLEYQFLDNKIPGALAADAGAEGGHVHIWSITADPVFDLLPDKKNSVYVTGGGGFYRKVTSFTDAEEVEECYYFCITGEENVVVGHFSSNQGGANIGIGITHKLGSADMGDSKMKLYAEARYLWLDTPKYVQGTEVGGTELIPVTIGIRW
jgi:hypothetical protein